MPRQRDPSETIYFLTETETERFFDEIQPERDLALFTVIYRHGLRATEACRLTCSSIDLETETIRVDRLKGSKTTIQPLDRRTIRLLQEYLDNRFSCESSEPLFLSQKGGHLSRQQVDRLYRRYALAAQLPPSKHHVHCLKHSIATHLLKLSNGNVAMVQGWLGHKNIANTMVYADLLGIGVNSQVASLADKLPR